MKNVDIIPPSLFFLFGLVLFAGQLHIPPLSLAIFLALLMATAVASMILYRGKSSDEGSGGGPN